MNFFKNIRQNLIENRNFKKYSMYAIGEILLVMTGISLAFQLDNWNENRIMNNTETRYYENIKEQIFDDKDLIMGQMNFNSHFMAQFKFANEIIETNDRTKMDTLGLIVRNLSEYSDFDRQGNIYETLGNSGEIKLLQNNEIVNGIRELEEKYIYINRMESIHYDAMMNHTVAVINPVLKYASGEIMKPNEVYSFEFQNLIIILIRIMNEKDRTYNDAINQINMLTRIIDAELSQ